MIVSLTGFGRGEVERDGLRYTVELRSVNNRYLEVTTKLPRSLMPYETDLRGRIRQRIERGKVMLFIQEGREAIRQEKLNFDVDSARNLVDGLRSLADETGIRNDLSIGDLTRLVEWFTGSDESEELAEKRLSIALEALDRALNEFDAMRSDEGKNLQNDFQARLDHLGELVSNIESRSDENRTGALDRLRERIEKYIPSDQVDSGRLEQEVAYIIERMDITEEIVRLKSHIGLFSSAMEEGGYVGKRLNFILQEMNREVNTIGSKAQDAQIASWVVEAKEELEKVREQVQNVA